MSKSSEFLSMTDSVLTDDDLLRLKELRQGIEYKLPWTCHIEKDAWDQKTEELWSISSPDKNGYSAEVITCDSGVYGPGVPTGKFIVEIANQFDALLSRLETAEKVCVGIEHVCEAHNLQGQAKADLEAWRKACGK